MIARFLLALVSGLVWLLFIPEPSFAAWLVGSVLGWLVLSLLRPRLPEVSWIRLPSQIAALLVLGATLYRDIVLSSMDVARRVFSRDPGLNPDFIKASIQNPEDNLWLAALCGSAVSLTPGELVVDIEGNDQFNVHALDAKATHARLPEELNGRVMLLRRVMGRG